MTTTDTTGFTLADRYRETAGEMLLTGMQALVRLPLELNRREERDGRRTGVFISGYEGSPLAGYDLELLRQRELLEVHDIVVRPSVNEELAATSVMGSQLASVSPSCEFDGVVGLWYGKAPGLDRASDALRHASLGGAADNGGALVLVGDDSTAKSSTVPSSSETAMAELGLAVLSPSDPQEIIGFGLHGIWLSRFSGLYAGLKLATNVLDGSATVDLDAVPERGEEPPRLIDGVQFRHAATARFTQPALGELEATLSHQRRELALRYIVANGLNRIEGDAEARIGIVAAGAAYRDSLQALERLGIAPDDLSTSSVRLLKLGAISPLDPAVVREFADGLDEIIVVEEKRALIETAVKGVLFDAGLRVRVLGKGDGAGGRFLRESGDLPPDYLAELIGTRLFPDGGAPAGSGEPEQPLMRTLLPVITRTPYFCSGCPHNRSTVVPEGSLVGAGIGCHALATLMPSDRVGDFTGLCQMGGEGAAWTGMAPFVEEDHLFQNIGDGTFHHSGSLAIRAAVAAGVNITYKLLYNDAVAMTGGQTAVGKMAVPQVVQELLAEGVARVVITTEDTARYRRVRLPKGVEVRDRRELIPTQEELAKVPGVTVLIHDQECATELRRKRKRGMVETPTKRAFINERLCEGCGDCGQKSNCLSVQPVETLFGRKTRIDQATCNLDYSCLDGDCPSFVEVVPGSRTREEEVSARPVELPEPRAKVDPHRFNVRLVGIGGTGVVTSAQILAMAGSLAGMKVRGLDQLGLAQKGGPVVSDMKFASGDIDGANKIDPGECDLLLGNDLLVASDPRHLAVIDDARTIAIVSTSIVPTGHMVLSPSTAFPSIDDLTETIGENARSEDSHFVDARTIAVRALGSDQFANMMLIGMAYQTGALPLPLSALNRAVELNGAAVASNLRAIELGRRVVVEGAETFARSAGGIAHATGELLELLSELELDAELRDRLGLLAGELTDYQDRRYATTFLERVAAVIDRERELTGRAGALTATVGESLFKLMAYKDEYETARLYLDPEFERSVRDQFGDVRSMRYKLHPPILRAIGLKNKLSLGPWFRPVFVALRSMRRLRGTIADPFGYARVRKVERRLIADYTALVEEVLRLADRDTLPEARTLLAGPQEIRGYEDIKLSSVADYERLTTEGLARLRSGLTAAEG
ncbi:indolepyruvate ferredoxin oxidoreductase family protein [Aeromicrobium piscarium]|uniref:indolepyruvate ferredoxin oxidoreductase family protein n=1 Tax=Aeromicrobium piscarium TaxID=2590901 RepID=UPI001C8F9519|nr:indolepyruvate ferredoxin oxidoreductase family protein [Aeromicrobium piscarium]